MGRPAVRRIEPHRVRRNHDATVIVGIGIVVLFALIGVVSAGIFIAGKVSASPSPAKSHTGSGPSVAAQDLARARAQATAIVTAAQSASQDVVKSATKNAKKKSNKIIADARRKAGQIVASARASVPATSPTATTTQPGTASGPTTTSPSTGTSTSSTTGTTLPPGTPNLSRLPANWLVVGYKVTFGSGPGDAGSITVLNRGKFAFSGVARVYYTGGGSSRAIFTNLAPGQTAVLPLNGRAYTGRGYTIRLKHIN